MRRSPTPAARVYAAAPAQPPYSSRICSAPMNTTAECPEGNEFAVTPSGLSLQQPYFRPFTSTAMMAQEVEPAIRRSANPCSPPPFLNAPLTRNETVGTYWSQLSILTLPYSSRRDDAAALIRLSRPLLQADCAPIGAAVRSSRTAIIEKRDFIPGTKVLSIFSK